MNKWQKNYFNSLGYMLEGKFANPHDPLESVKTQPLFKKISQATSRQLKWLVNDRDALKAYLWATNYMSKHAARLPRPDKLSEESPQLAKRVNELESRLNDDSDPVAQKIRHQIDQAMTDLGDNWHTIHPSNFVNSKKTIKSSLVSQLYQYWKTVSDQDLDAGHWSLELDIGSDWIPPSMLRTVVKECIDQARRGDPSESVYPEYERGKSMLDRPQELLNTLHLLAEISGEGVAQKVSESNDIIKGKERYPLAKKCVKSSGAAVIPDLIDFGFNPQNKEESNQLSSLIRTAIDHTQLFGRVNLKNIQETIEDLDLPDGKELLELLRDKWIQNDPENKAAINTLFTEAIRPTSSTGITWLINECMLRLHLKENLPKENPLITEAKTACTQAIKSPSGANLRHLKYAIQSIEKLGEWNAYDTDIVKQKILLDMFKQPGEAKFIAKNFSLFGFKHSEIAATVISKISRGNENDVLACWDNFPLSDDDSNQLLNQIADRDPYWLWRKRKEIAFSDEVMRHLIEKMIVQKPESIVDDSPSLDPQDKDDYQLIIRILTSCASAKRPRDKVDLVPSPFIKMLEKGGFFSSETANDRHRIAAMYVNRPGVLWISAWWDDDADYEGKGLKAAKWLSPKLKKWTGTPLFKLTRLISLWPESQTVADTTIWSLGLDFIGKYEDALKQLKEESPEFSSLIRNIVGKHQVARILKGVFLQIKAGKHPKNAVEPKRTLIERWQNTLRPLLHTVLRLQAAQEENMLWQQEMFSCMAKNLSSLLAHDFKLEQKAFSWLSDVWSDLQISPEVESKDLSIETPSGSDYTLALQPLLSTYFPDDQEERLTALKNKTKELSPEERKKFCQQLLSVVANVHANGIAKEELHRLVRCFMQTLNALETKDLIGKLKQLSSSFIIASALEKFTKRHTMKAILDAAENATPGNIPETVIEKTMRTLQSFLGLQGDPSTLLVKLTNLWETWKQPELLIDYYLQHQKNRNIQKVFTLWLQAALDGPEAMMKLQFESGKNKENLARFDPNVVSEWKKDRIVEGKDLAKYLEKDLSEVHDRARKLLADQEMFPFDESYKTKDNAFWIDHIKEIKKEHRKDATLQKTLALQVKIYRILVDIDKLDSKSLTFRKDFTKLITSLESPILKEGRILKDKKIFSDTQWKQMCDTVKKMQSSTKETKAPLDKLEVKITVDAQTKWTAAGIESPGSCQDIAQRQFDNIALTDTISNGLDGVAIVTNTETNEMEGRALPKIGLNDKGNPVIVQEPCWTGIASTLPYSSIVPLLVGATMEMAKKQNLDVVAGEIVIQQLGPSSVIKYTNYDHDVEVLTGLTGLAYEDTGQMGVKTSPSIHLSKEKVFRLHM